MLLFQQRLGIVESVGYDTYIVSYRESLISARLADTVTEKPHTVSDAQSAWNHSGLSAVT